MTEVIFTRYHIGETLFKKVFIENRKKSNNNDDEVVLENVNRKK